MRCSHPSLYTNFTIELFFVPFLCALWMSTDTEKVQHFYFRDTFYMSGGGGGAPWYPHWSATINLSDQNESHLICYLLHWHRQGRTRIARSRTVSVTGYSDIVAAKFDVGVVGPGLHLTDGVELGVRTLWDAQNHRAEQLRVVDR